MVTCNFFVSSKLFKVSQIHENLYSNIPAKNIHGFVCEKSITWLHAIFSSLPNCSVSQSLTNTWKFIHSNVPAKNIHGFVCEKRALELELGMKFSFTHHQTCNFKFLPLQNFSLQRKLLLQWKHFLEVNYPMFPDPTFCCGHQKAHAQWRRISFPILWVVFFF